MVHKQAANSIGAQGDGFSDDDPLAELARIVGFEQAPRRETLPGPAGDTPRDEPVFSLHDELLGEFDGYVEPQQDRYVQAEVTSHRNEPAFEPMNWKSDGGFRGAEEPVWAVSEPSFAAPEPARLEREAFVQPVEPSYEPQDVYETVPELATNGYAAVAAQPQPSLSWPDVAPAALEDEWTPAPAQDEPASFDLADELEFSVSEPVMPPVQTEVPRLRLPLANFQVPSQSARRPEPQFELPQPASEPRLVMPYDAAPSTEAVAGLDAGVSERKGFATAPSLEAQQRPATVEPLPVSSTELRVEPPAFDWSQVPVGPVEPVARRGGSVAHHEPEAEPVFSLDFAQELAESEAFADVAADVEHHAQPARNVGQVSAASDSDFFSDQDFELQLDELDIDLSELEPVAQQPVPPSPVRAQLAAPAQMAIPAARQSYAAPEYRVSVQSTAPAAIAPQAAAWVDQPKTAPAAAFVASATPDSLAFDPAEIAEQDDFLEAIAVMDVPEVQVAETPAQPQVSNDFDLDLDSELANLLSEQVVQSQPVAAEPQVTASAAAIQSNDGPVDEFAAFEKALEEDFKTALTPPVPDQRINRGHIKIVGHGQGGYRQLKPYLMAGTAAVVLLAGAGGIYAWIGSGAVGSLGSGDPVVIAADTSPTKIVPEDPGGKTVPNQDKAVYDRVAGNASDGPTQPSLISSEEEPVDVVQRTLIPENPPLEGEGEFMGTPVGETEDPRLLPESQQASASQEDPATVTPRRVRTMIVRPDGSLVTQEVPAATETASAAPVLAPPAVSNENSGEAVNTVAARAVTPDSDSAPAAPATTEVAAVAPMPAAVPANRPADQPVNIVGTVTDQGNLRPAQPATQENVPTQTAAVTASPSETGASSGFAIQIASLPSQADAERSYKSLIGRFGNILGGKPHEIREAAIPGKGTYYRVRILAPTREEAVALCEQYRDAGGSCLVAR
ncbi:SPOR domain-containing protein [Peteryoungia ipomoeae]|uniref:SPOR domain-containing protein n=1 Tax=Peteryoungia ipomoeae TaxID=1210932 RepID=A0A4S8P5H0_9HYPH|nr:SPOR domain-containing protein [Peteryoungia ipomoeae]THV25388.1 hypothetical protein FAA97_04100 [Peteryoungia ipomoeae]